MTNGNVVMEVQRVHNLLVGFGWVKKEQITGEDFVRVGFQKTVELGAEATIPVEVERMTNLVSGFGWVVEEQSTDVNTVMVHLKKKMVVVAPATPG